WKILDSKLRQMSQSLVLEIDHPRSAPKIRGHSVTIVLAYPADGVFERSAVDRALNIVSVRPSPKIRYARGKLNLHRCIGRCELARAKRRRARGRRLPDGSPGPSRPARRQRCVDAG